VRHAPSIYIKVINMSPKARTLQRVHHNIYWLCVYVCACVCRVTYPRNAAKYGCRGAYPTEQIRSGYFLLCNAWTSSRFWYTRTRTRAIATCKIKKKLLRRGSSSNLVQRHVEKRWKSPFILLVAVLLMCSYMDECELLVCTWMEIFFRVNFARMDPSEISKENISWM
jgi:hypothetical protein